MNGCDLIRLNCKPSKYKTSKTLDLIWLTLMIPGMIFGILSAIFLAIHSIFLGIKFDIRVLLIFENSFI